LSGRKGRKSLYKTLKKKLGKLPKLNLDSVGRIPMEHIKEIDIEISSTAYVVLVLSN